MAFNQIYNSAVGHWEIEIDVGIKFQPNYWYKNEIFLWSN